MAATGVSISCTSASGKSLKALGELVKARARLLGELTQDAVIAIAINILNSLRADTLDARKGDKADPPKSIIPRGDLAVSFSGARHAPVLRDKSGNRVDVDGFLHFAQRGVKAKTLIPIRVVPAHERIKPYFVAASSTSAALKFEGAQIRKRIKAKGGLARAAFSVAMAKISTRNDGGDTPPRAKALASQLSQITVSSSGFASGSLSLDYHDQLNYAIPALRSGAAGVELAMQKAANKVAGLINHTLHKAKDFEHDIPTPFPEVRKRK